MTVYLQIDKLKLRIFSIFLHIPSDVVAVLVNSAFEAAEDRRNMIRSGEDEVGMEKQDAMPHRIHVRIRCNDSIYFDSCDKSVRETDWRCRKRGMQAT